MATLLTTRDLDLKHHVQQGAAWLGECGGETHAVALCYAAFEFRLAIERIAVHYWRDLLGRKVQADDLATMDSFKRTEKEIYRLAGHQRAINGHFAFVRVLLRALGIDWPLATPDMGQLSRHWHQCSEFCHVGWTFASQEAEVRRQAHQVLTCIKAALEGHTNGLIAWPKVLNGELADLRDRFLAGRADESEVVAHLKSTGAWARMEHPDGRMEFVGRPIPPSAPADLSPGAAAPGHARESGMPDAGHDDPERRTRERAYLLWERAGRPEGRAEEFWAQARREEAHAPDGRTGEEAQESFPPSDPPSRTGITGEGRRGD